VKNNVLKYPFIRLDDPSGGDFLPNSGQDYNDYNVKCLQLRPEKRHIFLHVLWQFQAHPSF